MEHGTKERSPKSTKMALLISCIKMALLKKMCQLIMLRPSKGAGKMLIHQSQTQRARSPRTWRSSKRPSPTRKMRSLRTCIIAKTRKRGEAAEGELPRSHLDTKV